MFLILSDVLLIAIIVPSCGFVTILYKIKQLATYRSRSRRHVLVHKRTFVPLKHALTF